MKKAMVFGAGVSGQGAKKLLEKMGYLVYLIDDRTGILSIEGEKLLDEVDIFIKSPGVPYNNLVLQAKEKKIKVIDEIELCYQYLKENGNKTKIIAVTGTNGKTTTTAKITELLVFAGYSAEYAGNIGRSFSELVLENKKLDYVVLELSSFQLENLENFEPEISMVTNLTPDHLSRYSSVQEYYDTKFNICKNQKEGYFIYNIDCNEITKREKLFPKNILKVSQNKKCDISLEKYQKELFTLKGKHNLENILFIIAVGKLCNISEEKIAEFLYTTKNLEHRMEEFFEYRNIKFINDSKGTNIDSTKFAVEAFENSILICGGYNKGLEWKPLAEIIKNSVKDVYLIGEIATILEEKLIELSYPRTQINLVGTITNALMEIKKKYDGDKEEVVILSPATSSYDQFKNYEERGKFFKEETRRIFGR